MYLKMLGNIEQRINIASASANLNLQAGADCLHWSEDDRIAVLTVDNIAVLNILHSSVESWQLDVREQLINCPVDPNPHFNSGVTVSALTAECNETLFVRHEVQQLLFSAPLSACHRARVVKNLPRPNLPPGDGVCYTGFRVAKWSPIGAGGAHCCHLAMVTRDQQLYLATGRGRAFCPALDLTPILPQWLAHNNWPLLDTTLFTPSQPLPSCVSDKNNSHPDLAKAAKILNQEMLKQRLAAWVAKVNRAEANLRDKCDTKELRRCSSLTFRDGPKSAETKVKEIWEHSNRLSQMAIEDVCWSPVCHEQSYGVAVSELLVFTLTGHAVLYSIKAHPEDVAPPSSSEELKKEGGPSLLPLAERQNFRELEATLTCHFDLQTPLIVSSLWVRSPGGNEYLMIGESNGHLKVFSVCRDLKDGPVTSINRLLQLFDGDGLIVRSPCIVQWSTAATDSKEEVLTVAVARGSCLSVAKVLLCPSTQAAAVVSEANALISRHTISGIVCGGGGHLYCSTGSGMVYDMKYIERNVSTEQQATTSGNKDIKVEINSIEDDCDSQFEVTEEMVTLQSTVTGKNVQLRIIRKRAKSSPSLLTLRGECLSDFVNSKMSYTSMVASKNKALYAMAETICVPYDHLVLREPSKVVLYVVNTTSTLMDTLLERWDDINRSVYDWCDALSSFSFLVSKGELHSLDALAALTNNKGSNNKPLLYLARTFAQMSASGLITPNVFLHFSSWRELEEKIEVEVLEAWLRSVLSSFHSDYTWSDGSLPPLVKSSLSIMCDYCVQQGPTEYSRMASEILMRLQAGVREQCSRGRCQRMINLESVKVASCTEDHVTQRCCRSLLSSGTDSECMRCGVMVNSVAALSLCNDKVLSCTFCDGPVTRTSFPRAALTYLHRASTLLPSNPKRKRESKTKAQTNARKI